jgi:hypothetical protein
MSLVHHPGNHDLRNNLHGNSDNIIPSKIARYLSGLLNRDATVDENGRRLESAFTACRIHEVDNIKCIVSK